MKLNVNWKQLGKALWAAIKPVLLGAIGGGIVGISTGIDGSRVFRYGTGSARRSIPVDSCRFPSTRLRAARGRD